MDASKQDVPDASEQRPEKAPSAPQGDEAGLLDISDEETLEIKRSKKQFQSLTTQRMAKAEAAERLGLIAEKTEVPAAPAPAEAIPGRAHECLEIRTPLEEFETYVRARIDTLTRLGEKERVQRTLSALELGKQRLQQAAGNSGE